MKEALGSVPDQAPKPVYARIDTVPTQKARVDRITPKLLLPLHLDRTHKLSARIRSWLSFIGISRPARTFPVPLYQPKEVLKTRFRGTRELRPATE
jgi:hypothetical protein